MDKYANKVVQNLGYRNANWLPLVQFLIGISFVLNSLVCFSRADFSTNLVIVLAIFFLNDHLEVNRDKFRWLPLL